MKDITMKINELANELENSLKKSAEEIAEKRDTPFLKRKLTEKMEKQN